MVTVAYDIIKVQQVLHLIVCLMSWNVRSLYTAVTFTAAAKELARYTLDLVGVQEVRGGRDSAVGIATGYGLDGPGIESRCGGDLPHQSRPALGPTQPPMQWVLGLSRGQSGRGVALTTHPI